MTAGTLPGTAVNPATTARRMARQRPKIRSIVLSKTQRILKRAEYWGLEILRLDNKRQICRPNAIAFSRPPGYQGDRT